MIPSPATIWLPQRSLPITKRVLNNLTTTTKRQNTYQLKQNIKSSPNKQQHNKKYSKTKIEEPGLVTFYDIGSWNRAGLFLQPQSPHGPCRW